MDERNKGRFLTGNKGGPGRPRGSRNKLGEDFIEALFCDWLEHGTSVIETVRQERPHEYLKLVAGLIPKQIEIPRGAFDDVSDDELAAMIEAARAAIDAIEADNEAASPALSN